jgi:hypothetical protein
LEEEKFFSIVAVESGPAFLLQDSSVKQEDFYYGS